MIQYSYLLIKLTGRSKMKMRSMNFNVVISVM